ncbi:MAG: hypothetical protein QM778_24335 [Myxococcales bacterium]
MRTQPTSGGAGGAATQAAEPRPAAEPRVQYPSAREQIQTGDVLLFRGTSAVSRIIRWGSRSPYSHAGLAAWWGDRLIVFQAVSHGAQVIPLSSAVDAYDGQVDWWTPHAGVTVDRERLVEHAVTMLGRAYAFHGVFDLMWRMTQRRFRGMKDRRAAPKELFCSQYVSYCYRKAGIDLVDGTDDGSTSPGDLANSGRLVFRGILHADPAEKAARRQAAPGKPKPKAKV